MNITIKRMETDEEIEGKADVHWRTWREAYDGILPADFQKAMTLEKCRNFSYKYPENTFIARDDSKIVGFFCYGTFQDVPTPAGEIFALYILKDYYGTGLAQQLMGAALEELNEFPEVYLWVLEANERAIAFYKKMGFAFDGEEKFINLGGPFKAKRMVYRRNPAILSD